MQLLEMTDGVSPESSGGTSTDDESSSSSTSGDVDVDALSSAATPTTEESESENIPASSRQILEQESQSQEHGGLHDRLAGKPASIGSVQKHAQNLVVSFFLNKINQYKSIVITKVAKLGWPEGPDSLKRLFHWPESYARKLIDEPGVKQSAEKVLKNYNFVVNDAYSGMGTASYAFHLSAKHFSSHTLSIFPLFSIFYFFLPYISCAQELCWELVRSPKFAHQLPVTSIRNADQCCQVWPRTKPICFSRLFSFNLRPARRFIDV